MMWGTFRIVFTGSPRRHSKVPAGSAEAQPSDAVISALISRISRAGRQTYQGYPGTSGPIIPAGMSIMPSPLESTARWKRPRAPGEVRWPVMAAAPKDEPATVTRVGSPPKEAALRCTQRNAACWSWSPNVPEPGSPCCAYPPKIPSR